MFTVNMTNSTLDDRRKVLEKAGLKFFSVKFVKKDGEVRDMQVKKYTNDAFTYGRENAHPNPVAHKPEYFTAVDVKKGEFRNINMNNLIEAKVNGVTYIFSRK